ncbi:MAG: CvpA family protein, partial [Planctomycetes bacterium]|nr:CvpA family protein [Planctomycetota bacterium]
ISSLLALNYYEPLAVFLGEFGMASFGPQTISLMGLFILSLLVMRELTDRLIRGNMNFPLIIDRIGAAAFGLISSMIVVGMIALGFQHLRISATILGFNRCENFADVKDDKQLFPGADSFVVSLVSQISRYSFAGENKFFQSHPDFLRELYMNRLVLDPGSRIEAHRDTIKKTRKVWLIDYDLQDISTSQAVTASAGQRFVVVRMVVETSSRTEDHSGAADADLKVRFTLGSVRLIGFDKDRGYSRYPIGILKPGGRLIEKIPLDQGKILTSARKEVDLVFEWPTDLKKSPPRILEFKRSAQVFIPSNEKIQTFKLGSQDIYEASVYTTEADIQAAKDENTPFLLEKIKVVKNRSNQPYREMLLPSNEILADRMSSINRSQGFQNFHPDPIVVSGRSSDESSSYTQLDVPPGFSLVFVSAKRNPLTLRSGKSLFVQPLLVDTQGREIRSVGYALQGSLDDKSVRGMAYSKFNSKGSILKPSDRSWPDVKIKIQDLGGQVEQIVSFYLVPKRSVPVGILLARTPPARNRTAVVWRWDKQIDAVIVGEF